MSHTRREAPPAENVKYKLVFLTLKVNENTRLPTYCPKKTPPKRCFFDKAYITYQPLTSKRPPEETLPCKEGVGADVLKMAALI